MAAAALTESPPTMPLKTIMQIEDLSRRLSQEGEREEERRNACAGGGGAALRTSGDCVSPGEIDEKGCLRNL